MDKRRAKKKVPKGPKSCLNCRKSKQRCDIPDRSAVRPSAKPQPDHLACHRCKVLRLPCTVDIALEEWEEAASPMSLSAAHPNGSHETPTPDPSSAKRRKSAHHPTSTSQASDSRVHVFDPFFAGDGYGDARAGSRVSDVSRPPKESSRPVIDIAEKLQSLRPFPYLFRLCSTQPNFLASPVSASVPGRTLDTILHKHASHIDWEEMDGHLQDYSFFLPFLETFGVHSQADDPDGFYLATRLYLAALRTDKVDLQGDLLLFLRPHTLSCVLRGPASVAEASALVALALYEPLILVNSAEQMQLDGSGLLAAASTATKILDLDKTPTMMLDFHRLGHQRDPSNLLRDCSLWIAIALTSAFNTLAGNFHQRPFLECKLDDLDVVESFCNRLLERTHRSPYADMVARLQLLVFRYRSLCSFQDLIKDQFATLNTLAIKPFGPAQACLVEGVSKALELAKDTLAKLKEIRQRSALPNALSDIWMDYMEFETEQLHMFCIINFTEACIMRIGSSYGRPIALSTIVQRIITDKDALDFAGAVVGVTKSDMCRKLVTLFANFTSRWCKPAHRHSAPSGFQQHLTSASMALPPAYVCALILTNVKTMADYVGGFVGMGSFPRDCLDDCEAGITVCLCRSHADDLQRYAVQQTKELFHAKGHRDLFRLTADIAMRTSHTIHEWAATTKGLRIAMQPSQAARTIPLSYRSSIPEPFASSLPNEKVALQEQQNALTTIRADGQDFERLLEDILSTPILFS